jgi:hypothetical protein
LDFSSENIHVHTGATSSTFLISSVILPARIETYQRLHRAYEIAKERSIRGILGGRLS